MSIGYDFDELVSDLDNDKRVTEWDLDNHKSLDLTLLLPIEPLDILAADLIDQFEADRIKKRSHRKKYLICLRILLANMLYCERVSSKLYLKVSLDNNFYSKLPRELNPYRVSAQLLKEVILWLKSKDKLDIWPGFRTAGKQKRTRIKATKLLLAEFKESNLLKVSIKGDPPATVLIMKDQEKKICTFRSSVSSKEMEERLNRFNELMSATTIEAQNCTLPPQYFYRVFNEKCFESGGRYYGAGIQNLSKDDRSKLKINGNDVVEHDFSGLHVNMLYGIEGKQYSSDPYAISGYDRDFVKLAVLILLNADKRRSALRALNRKKKDYNYSKEQVLDLVAKVEDRHAGIKQYFFKSESKHLQFLDSQIAELIINEFVNNGYPILPIHDSFIVEDRHSALLKVTMLKAYKQIMKNDELIIDIQ